MEYLFNVIRFLLVTFLIIEIVDIKLMGFLHIRMKNQKFPSKYIIKQPNYTEIQGECECAGFSSAYIYRHFGYEAKGFDLYDAIPAKYKLSAGTVYPKGVMYCLTKKGIKAQYCKGNINVLKSEVSKGVPVIVMIKVREDKNWLHYIPVVGYDEEYIYLAESYEPLINCQEEHYNRKIEIEKFKKLWNTKELKMPLYSNTFYRIM